MQNKKKVWVQGFSHIMPGLADEPEQKSSHHNDGNRTFQVQDHFTSGSQNDYVATARVVYGRMFFG